MSKHIFWIASYPKSGNTLLRAILSSLFFSKDGTFSFELIKTIQGLENKWRLNFIKENNPNDFESNFGLEMGRYEEDWYFAGTGNLDECNGAYDVNGDYGYYITDKYPFTPPCTFGVRDTSFSKESPTLP